MIKKFKYQIDSMVSDLFASGLFEVNTEEHSIITFENGGVFNFWLDKPTGLHRYIFELALSSKCHADAIVYIDFMKLIKHDFPMFVQGGLVSLEQTPEQIIKPHSRLQFDLVR